ncbi:hypothetical protein Shal_0351 [Shewanella halifaxensis HAW-EB4]|uniref:Orphan protein n=1 Tax=Shewanella halifaxensis (strain HAW-EB4) TaxID=458817 RepID=B0TPQ6_SHEHH|nr:hypothetical protein [Shewanella halifaxensis]ABZ74927.1 hypothetical protein Shal_0351 [Shewanella halifaxensis HAW-EB4]
MEQSITRHKMDTTMDTVTIANGYWYYFNDEEVRITAHGSGFTGKETIYVNDELITEKRNLGMKSAHEFCYLGNDYQVTFEVSSLLTATVVCTLYKNGKYMATETKAYLNMDSKSALKRIFMFFVAGMVFGGLAAWLVHQFTG